MRKAIVKVTTERGYWCLAEIKGLKEGTIIEGKYTPRNNFFDFSWNGQDAMLIIGENAELIDTGVNVAVRCLDTKDIIKVFGSITEARRFVKKNKINNIEYLYLGPGNINDDGDLNWDCALRIEK